MKGRFSKHSDEYLKAQLLQHFDNMSIHTLAREIGVDSKRLSNIGKSLGLKRDRRQVWDDEMEAYLIANYANTENSQIAKALNITESAINYKAYVLKLKKTEEFKRFQGLKSGFKLGNKTWNTGMKGISFPGSEKGHFKKGNLPHNTKQADGEITIRKDSDGKLHEYVRVSLGKWIPRKIIIWEQHNGKIEKGMLVAVKDGNTMNSNIENLELITRKENRLRNSGGTTLSDGYIARCLTAKTPELKEAVLANKELINLQRTIYQVNRLWKMNTKSKQPTQETPTF